MSNIQLLIFGSNEEDYAIPIEYVKEIIKITKIVPIPNSNPYILGIINLRDQIVAVLDLPKILNQKKSNNEYLIILDYEDQLLGIIVNEVKEVLTLDDSKIEDVPIILENNKYINSIAHYQDRMIGLLNINQIFNTGTNK